MGVHGIINLDYMGKIKKSKIYSNSDNGEFWIIREIYSEKFRIW